jgi:hypothetical protein
MPRRPKAAAARDAFAEPMAFESASDHIVLLAPRGRRLVLDTGSPFSVGRGTFRLLGSSHRLAHESIGVDLERVGNLIGTRLDGLIGTDVVGRAPFTIDWSSSQVSFGVDSERAGGAVVPMPALFGIPRVECRVAGRSVSALVDTGAAISFLAEPWDGLPKPTGKRHEFFLSATGVEEFDTPVRRLSVQCGKTFESTFGQLPAQPARALKSASIDAILGADLWKTFPVTFDVSGGRLVVGD